MTDALFPIIPIHDGRFTDDDGQAWVVTGVTRDLSSFERVRASALNERQAEEEPAQKIGEFVAGDLGTRKRTSMGSQATYTTAEAPLVEATLTHVSPGAAAGFDEHIIVARHRTDEHTYLTWYAGGQQMQIVVPDSVLKDWCAYVLRMLDHDG